MPQCTQGGEQLPKQWKYSFCLKVFRSSGVKTKYNKGWLAFLMVHGINMSGN